MDFKISIIYEIKDDPWGGGNQFLKALRQEFIRVGCYTENPGDADVIVFNSHHFLDDVYRAKTDNPGAILIHRVDGPISRVRGKDIKIDRSIFEVNALLADGTVFQSNWSREKNRTLGMKRTPYEEVITNAPDPAIFNCKDKSPYTSTKVKLIATSWSDNPRKGFDVYEYLDNNLDFDRYEMTFIGNSPVTFKNIRGIRPVPSIDVARHLKACDIFVTASRNDPCSNSLIEALHCSLPAVARRDGGHPEIIGGAGEFFDDNGQAIDAIDIVAGSYSDYQAKIRVPDINMVSNCYIALAEQILHDRLHGRYTPKRIDSRTKLRYFARNLVPSIKKAISK